MQISLDTKKLGTIARKSHLAKFTAELEKRIKQREKEEEERCRLAALARKKLAEIISSVPAALEEAAKEGWEDKDGWHISARIPIVFAPTDDIYSGYQNRFLLDEDRSILEVVHSEIYNLNRENNQKGVGFSIKESTRPSNPKIPHPNSKYSGYITTSYLEITAIVPRSE